MQDICFPHSQCLEPCCSAYTKGSAPLQNHMDTQVVCLLFWNKSEVAVMSDSLRPRGLQPTRLFHPWDFPGKSTGVDCYFLSRGSSQPRYRTWASRKQADALPSEPSGKPHTENLAIKSESMSDSCSVVSDPMDYTVHGIFQGRILEWVAIPFPRGIFPTQGLNPGLLHCRWILYQLSYQRSP